jgi:hypothetical protein
LAIERPVLALLEPKESSEVNRRQGPLAGSATSLKPTFQESLNHTTILLGPVE